MKLSLFKKVCLTVMGIGVVGSLVSVGTFASFTAVTTNPGNTFAAGTLTIQNTTTGANFATTNPNYNGTNQNPNGTASDCGTTNEVGASCRQVIQSTRVTTGGMEPGQFLQGTVKVTNTGNLPSTIALEIQNATSSAGTNCGVACSLPDSAFTITIGDSTGQCLYGNTTSGAAPASVTGIVYKAVGAACDDLTSASLLGTAASPVLAGADTNDYFSGFKTLGAGSAGSTGLIYVPGSGSTYSLLTGGVTGDISSGGAAIKQWVGGGSENHTFTITVAFPQTGTTTSTSVSTGDTVIVGKDNAYQSASLSFDLVWYAFQ